MANVREWVNRSVNANRCAARLSQQFTIEPEAWRGNLFADALLGNQIGTMVDALLGPQRVRAGAQLAIDSPLPKASLNAGVQAIIQATPTGRYVQVISYPISHNPGVYNPLTATSRPVTFGATSAGRAIFSTLQNLFTGKLVFDVGAYLGALWSCSGEEP